MTDHEFDHALVEAALAEAGEAGWRGVSVAAAARRAGLDLGRARSRFPVRLAVLMRLGEQADRAALEGAGVEGSAPSPLAAREMLFDMLMRRIDVCQAQRAGVVAVLQALPTDPLTGLALAGATARSMGWMLGGAGIETTGSAGMFRVPLLVGAWLATIRAWMGDESADLAATMAALDRALDQIGGFDGVFAQQQQQVAAAPEPVDEVLSPS